ncbi:glycosyltransferase involved in cell wall biosynthesis [Rhizobium sp. BIGb0125]|uniref:glycosyltransferase family 2 protein n=1 Tax=Rhizobium sp. BIGb0125 TaxID=2940618 RepID=UPI002167C498|nr:glycosyltransferase [Rhizobium sp. BIGb0125]MCS4240900.1 glycosyltransferase involved in cell wall biosynthesis [Rhizobium sp. BIGb0125]
MTTQAPHAVVCIPSFRRPDGLKKTLASLATQQVDFSFAIVVIDNDGVGQEALAVTQSFLADTGMLGQAFVEPQQGNCYAINSAFAKARSLYPSASYFLMIDDDEIASPIWLANMVRTAETLGVDIVGGPVIRAFDKPASKGVELHPLFGSIEAKTGPVDMIHGSGNCLLSKRVFERLEKPQFDVQFNFLGGGDMDFFTRSKRSGLRFGWSAEAIITEFVPVERMEPKWIMTRSLRTGIINYSIDRARRPGLQGAVLLQAKNVISLGLSLVRAVSVFAKTGQPLVATHPVLLSVGRVLASIGITLSPYKAKPQS